jgi:hypothetical protein
MASGHEYRTCRPNTWLLRPTPQVKILLANPEPSTHGPSRHFACAQQSSRYQVKADIKRQAGPAVSVENDSPTTEVAALAMCDAAGLVAGRGRNT